MKTDVRLRERVGLVGKALLVFGSTVYARKEKWSEATALSRRLLAVEDDPAYRCVIQAMLTWLAGRPGAYRAFTEWKALQKMSETAATAADVPPEGKAMCRDAFRRVTADLAIAWHRTSDLSDRDLERLKMVYAAYEAVQQDVAADGPPARR